jgi:hypothetical protein
VLDHVGDSRADDAGDHQREEQVREILAAPEPLDEPPAEQEARRHARAIRAEMKEAKVNEIGKHREVNSE